MQICYNLNLLHGKFCKENTNFIQHFLLSQQKLTQMSIQKLPLSNYINILYKMYDLKL